MMSKWSKDEKVLVGGLCAIITTLVLIAVNCATSTEISREAPAATSFSYCAQWTAAYKSQTCIRYAAGTEVRIVKHMDGILFDYDTYEVVR
jgi:hypothetical protein